MKKVFAVLWAIFILFSFASAFAQTAFDDALANYQKGKFKKAVALLETYVAEIPSSDAYYLLGYANYKLGNIKKSARYFGEAYLIDPGFDPERIEARVRAK